MDTVTLEATGVANTAIVTDPGLDPNKQVNEDLAACETTAVGLLCVVCDGMGGHADGKLAAETAIAAILEHFRSRIGRDHPKQALEEAIALANQRVNALSTHGEFHAGATCVAIVVHAKGTEVAHVGDSRAHLMHRGAAAVITRDHSKVRQMVDAGLITPEEAKVHPDANQITRALGIAETVEIELRAAPVPHMAGDVFVLCSDGLSDLVTPEEMLEQVMRHDEPHAGQALVGMALGRGGHDNTTVAIVRVLVDADVPAAAVTAIGTPAPPLAAPARTTEVPPPPGSPRVPVAQPPAQPITERPPPPPNPLPSDPRVIAPNIAAAPPLPPATHLSPSENAAPRSTHVTESGSRSRATLFIGLGLAVFAIAIMVALYFVVEKKKQRVLVPVPHSALSSGNVAPTASFLPSQ